MKEIITKILILILLIILMIMIVNINAAYKTRIEENVDSSIEPWVIFVNNENIASMQTKTFDINELRVENPNIASGKLAPGAEIGLPIEIDATQTKNMDIRYDIVIEELDETYPNLKIKDVVEENANFEMIKTDVNTYTGIISKEDIENDVKHKLFVTVVWENDENNNELDTTLGTSEERLLLNIPLTVKVSQYSNETILEYTEEEP